MKLSSRLAVVTPILFIILPLNLFATDHLMVIQEVFPGTSARPDAQYVMLRMTSGGQNLVAADYVELQDATGVVLGTFGTFPANVANGGAICAYPNCPAIIIGTMAAQTLLGFNFDVVVDAQVGHVLMPQGGGRVCFRIGTLPTQIPDCVAYGNFTGVNTIATPTANACDANFGAPAAPLRLGFALTRGQFNCVAKENSLDFTNRFPHPVANNGANANVDTDADGLINVLDCDDINGDAGLYPPLGVADLSVNGSLTADWSWSAEPAFVGTSLLYDLAILRHNDLVTQPTCNAAGMAGMLLTGPGVPGTTFQESVQPLPGEVFYYLARSHTICGPAPFC